MRILLISPPAEKDLMKNARCDFVSWSGCQWFPMILGHLGSFLESRGYEVKLLDAQASGLTKEETQAIIAEYNADFSVVMTSRESIETDLVWMKYFAQRKKGARSCFISPFFLNPKARKISKDMECDFIVGEPEKGILEWIEGSEGYIKGKALTTEEYRSIPWVSKFLLKHCLYKDYMAPSEPFPFMDVMTGRGCSYGKCAFCLWPKTYRKDYMERELDDVVSEMEWIESLGIFKGVMIEDDNFPDERAMQFAVHKLYRNVKIPWSCLTRAELKLETMMKMKEAGCLNIHIGYESGCDRTLKRINKGLTVKQMEEFTANAKKSGLQIHGDFMIGIDQTEEEIYQTIEWACKLRPHTAQFQIYIPYMGDKQFHDPEHLKDLAVMAYKRFYGNPRNWPSVIKQLGKPRVIGRSLKKILGG